MDKAALFAKLAGECTEARLKLLDEWDWCAHPKDWAPWAMKLWLGTHLGHDERRSLFSYAMVQGMPPVLWARWARAQRGWLRRKKSVNELILMLDLYSRDQWRKKDGWHVKHSADHSMLVEVRPPAFAKEDFERKVTLRVRNEDGTETREVFVMEAGCRYFQHAIAELREVMRVLPRD
jgi:hypothetical protein